MGPGHNAGDSRDNTDQAGRKTLKIALVVRGEVFNAERPFDGSTGARHEEDTGGKI